GQCEGAKGHQRRCIPWSTLIIQKLGSDLIEVKKVLPAWRSAVDPVVDRLGAPTGQASEQRRQKKRRGQLSGRMPSPPGLPGQDRQAGGKEKGTALPADEAGTGNERNEPDEGSSFEPAKSCELIQPEHNGSESV